MKEIFSNSMIRIEIDEKAPTEAFVFLKSKEGVSIMIAGVVEGFLLEGSKGLSMEDISTNTGLRLILR